MEWEHLGDAMPDLPPWTLGDTWAPEGFQVGDGFVMYYTARFFGAERPDGRGSQCIGRAVSDAPEGPFVDESAEPMLCQPELGGSIDATAFTDTDGTMYLVWKNDGNCCGIPTEFWAQALTDDGLALTGEVPPGTPGTDSTVANLGVRNNTAWEGGVIEAPTIVLNDGTYYLFFSANHYGGVEYAVGYATADNLLGPYTDAEENPILATPEQRGAPPYGPGHQAVVADDDGDLWMLYHAWNQSFTEREMWIDELVFEDGAAHIVGPDRGPQAVP